MWCKKMSKLELKTMWSAILEFNNLFFEKWRDRDPVYLSNALAGEVGEICNLVKHMMGGGTKKVYVDINNIGVEGFDILVYLVLLLERLGINEKKFVELSQKKLNILYTRMI